MTVETGTPEQFRIGRVLTRTAQAFGGNLRTFLPILLVFSVLPDLAVGLLHMTIAPVDPENLDQALRAYGEVFITNLIAIAATIGVIYGSIRYFQGLEVSPGLCFAQIAPNYLAVFGIQLMVGAVVVLGSFLIVGGILAAVAWIAAIPIKIMENPPALSTALKRSAELTKDFRWQVFGSMLIAAVVLVLATVVYSVAVVSVPVAIDELVITPLFNATIVGAMAVFTGAVYFELTLIKGSSDTADIFT